ncbi:hypothetical protein GGI25_002090 [Coemansia spiralis]|uniref:Uncharacterized protein n=2 Tax=Coemansia TaxID=4863 RepID=A0A9W8GAR8_9FUNG|nr:hypothetical protein EDC05_005040 [Coemansia umbellata]KAJ2678706.1 hypothetical protein GGI25_002090 [Coemansia spiralis]
MEPSDIVLLALGLLCPPGSVALKRGLNRDFIICVALTLLFWVPGVAFSWYLIFKHPLENFRQRGGQLGQYHTIEEGLHRNSINSAIVSDEDHFYRSEDDDSRSTTMTSESATHPQQPLAPPLRKSRSGRIKRPSQRTRNSRSQSNGSVGASASRPSTALHEAARSYAMRHQQRQQTNPVKKWFVDRFYFADPTQVPPSLQADPNDELHELDDSR